MLKKRKNIFLFLTLLFCVLIPFWCFCKSSGTGRSSYKGGTVSVRSYQRKNGVWVRAHTRGWPKESSFPKTRSSYKSGNSYTDKSYYYSGTSNSRKDKSYYYNETNHSSIKLVETSHKTGGSSDKKTSSQVYSPNSKILVIAKNGDPRAFPASMKKQKYQEQGGICAICGKSCQYEEMEGDHIIPYSKGGQTNYGNLQMLCMECNRRKSNK